MKINQPSKPVEPFNLVGENSLIFSKEEVEKILRDNSYYIFVAAFLMGATFIFLSFNPVDVGISKASILIYGIFYSIIGVSIRYLKSRIASFLALASFGWALFSRVIGQDAGGLWFFTFIFMAASYRSVKASFYYHKKCAPNKQGQ